MHGPIIEGAQARLRPHCPEDAKAFIGFMADPEVIRYLTTSSPLSLAGEEAWIEERAADPNTFGWTIEHVDDRRPIGAVGLDKIDWRRSTGVAGLFIGDKALWGRGIASQALRLAVDHIFTSLPLRKIKASYLAPNVASGNLQATAGFREVGRWHEEYFRVGCWVDEVLTELSREDWQKRQLERDGEAG